MGYVSIIIPEAGQNLVTNPSFEYNTTGWIAAGATLARNVTIQKFGVTSLSLVTANAAVNEGAYFTYNPGAAGTYTAAADFYGTAGTVRIRLRDQTNATETASAAVTLASGWQRLIVTHTAGAACADLRLYVETSAQQLITFYVDAVQLENLAYDTTYIDGDQPGCSWNGAKQGSPSTRSGQARSGGRVYDLGDDWDMEVDQLAGLGMPPVAHRVRKYAMQPGALLQDIHVEPRVITLACHTNTTTEAGLYAARKSTIDALKNDLVVRNQPVVLRYTATGTNLETQCYYDAGLEGLFQCTAFEVLAIRLISYDPFWYEVGNGASILPVSQVFTSEYLTGRIEGEWQNVGPAAGGGTVLAMVGNDQYIYIGGVFTNWDGDAAAAYVVRYDKATQAYSPLTAAPDVLNGSVKALALAPNGTLYLGGTFSAAGAGGNLDFFCSYDGTAFAMVGDPDVGTAAITEVNAIAIGHDGIIYVGGDFLNWAGIAAADHAAQWDPSTVTWTAIAAACSDLVYSMLIAPNGDLYIGGNFTNWGDADGDYIVKWDGAALSSLSTGGTGLVSALAARPDGLIYIGGAFTDWGDANGDYITSWDGTAFLSLGTGLGAPGPVWSLAVTPDNILYASGAFLTAGGITLASRLARWNGYTWAHVDLQLPGTVVYSFIVTELDPVVETNYNTYAGTGTSGPYLAAEVTTVVNAGTRSSYPIFILYNSGSSPWATLATIRNEITGEELLFDLVISGGETITIDLAPKAKRILSDWRGFIPGEALPRSDFGTFALLPGDNNISVFVLGAPDVTGDNNNQLTVWQYINGISQANTNRGRMYVNIVDDGGGFFHVDLYMDSGRTRLVGHTASYNGAGDQDIVADNSSGLGGYITIVAATAADVDIVVYYTICDVLWRNLHLGVSGSV